MKDSEKHKIKKEKEDGEGKTRKEKDDLLARIFMLSTIVSWGDYDAKLKKFEIRDLNENIGTVFYSF